jgi:glycosyltransferase involved in cell wall biosynthesis
MGKRIKLGLIFSYDEGWIGGTYYILNLIAALKCMPDIQQPKIIILSDKSEDYIVAKSLGYNYLSYYNPHRIRKNIFQECIGVFFDLFFAKNLLEKVILKSKIDVLFPANNYSYYDLIKNKIFWIADFQHIHYPHFFSSKDILRRRQTIKKIASSEKKLLLSSYTAKKDWDSINLKKNCSVHVIPFAVTHPDFASISINSLLQEYSIDKPYFVIANQFWRHKNHLIVLKTALELKKKGNKWQFVLTGKNDEMNTLDTYISVNNFIHIHNLKENFIILGFIDRVKQLALMKNSVAVIQPSFFEGWSTVIEDAKCLQKRVIASDIPIHREQISSNVDFFDPTNHLDLVSIISKISYVNKIVEYSNYSQNVSLFANQFYKILK